MNISTKINKSTSVMKLNATYRIIEQMEEQ